MKKLVTLLSLVAVVSAYSQGTVNFNNRVTTANPPISAPVTYAPGGPVTDGNRPDNTVADANGYGGANARAALYGGAPGTPEAALVLLVPAVGFRSGTLAGYVNVGTAGTRVIDSVAPGAPAIVQVRAWDVGISGVDTYEDAVTAAATRTGYLGVSAILSIPALGGGSPPVTPPNLVGLETFAMTYVPEPSIIGLGILGTIAGLLVFRRRQ